MGDRFPDPLVREHAEPLTPPRGHLLTDAEHALVAKLGECAGDYVALFPAGHPRRGDQAEVVSRIHDLQARVLAHAAARAYPDRYRLL